MVNRISSKRKVKFFFGTSKCEYSEGPLRDVLRMSWGHPESTSQGRSLNVRLRRPLDDRLGRPWDVRLGRPRDDQIGYLGDVLGTLERNVPRTSWGPIFAGWATSLLNYDRDFPPLLRQSIIPQTPEPRETSFLYPEGSISPLRNKLANIVPLPSRPSLDNFSRPTTKMTD